MKTEPEKNYVLGDVPRWKQKKKPPKLLISDILLDYAKNSTIHGLRYIAEKGLTTVEKLFWLVIFTGSVVLCSFFIKNVYVKWRTSPVIITVRERLASVGEVPFPSVTICPQIKSKATIYNFDNEYEKFWNNTIENLNKFSDISLLCGGLSTGREYTDASVIDNIDSVAPRIDESLIFCRWKNNSLNTCDELFKKVYTAEGLCYNMNGLASEEIFRDTVQSNYKYSDRDEPTRGWSLEDGYTGTEDEPFPLQGSENDIIPDLVIYLSNNVADYFSSCNGLNSGFKIYIQHPADHPQSSLNYYAVLDGEVSSIAISADIIDSAPSLEDYPVEIKQCYFQNDRYLRYFKIYTASNCRAECQSNYTFEKCGCVGFYMPHDNSSQICSEEKLDCMASALNTLAIRELSIKISKDSARCHCLAECKSVEFHAEMFKTEFKFQRHLKALIKAQIIDDNMILNHLQTHYKFSQVELYFKKRQFIAMRRSELFGLTEVLANIGGLLGVFLGFSFLSLMELFYFITLRLGCSLKRDLKDEKVRLKSLTITNNVAEPITEINFTE